MKYVPQRSAVAHSIRPPRLAEPPPLRPALPVEVIEHVLRCVDAPDTLTYDHRAHGPKLGDWANLRLVNATFRDLSDALHPVRIGKRIKRGLIKRSLLGRLTEHDKTYAMSHYQSFTSLHLVAWFGASLPPVGQTIYQAIENLLKNCPNVKSLHLEGSPIALSMMTLPMDQRQEKIIENIVVEGHLAHLQKLTSTHFFSTIPEILHQLPELKQLSVKSWFMPQPALVKSQFSLPALEQFSLIGPDIDSFCKIGFVSQLAQCLTLDMPKLKDFKILGAGLHLDLDTFGKFPSLQTLDIDGLSVVSRRDCPSRSLPPSPDARDIGFEAMATQALASLSRFCIATRKDGYRLEGSYGLVKRGPVEADETPLAAIAGDMA